MTDGSRKARGTLAERIYRRLLVVYPRAFRQEHGAEAARVFAELQAEAPSRRAAWRLWLQSVGAVVAGGVSERLEDPVRLTTLVSDFRQDVALALRRMRQQPGFPLAAILVMGLGLGAATAVVGVADGVLIRPLPLPDADRVVFVTDLQGDTSGLPASWPEYEDWRREAQFFAGLTALSSNFSALEGPGGVENVRAGVVAGDFMTVLGVPPLAGRGLTDDDVARGKVVMLAEAFWRSRFGGRADVVGESLTIDGVGHTIVGVMPREAALIAERPDLQIWLPLDLPERFRARGFHLLTVIGRLTSGTPIEDGRRRADALAASLRDRGATTHGIGITGVRERLVGDSRSLLLVLSGAVGVLLLIVVANLSNLFLARAQARAREFAVRTAIGAGRVRLMRQVLTECLVLSVAGAMLALAVAEWGLTLVSATSQAAAALAPSTSADWRVVAFAVGAAFVVTLAFGLLSAIRAGGGNLPVVLGAGGSRAGTSRADRRARRVLVAAELALAVVLVAGAGLVTKSLGRLLDVDAGFRTDRRLAVFVNLRPAYDNPAAQVRFFEDLLARTRTIAGVESAGAVSHLPLDGGDTNGSFTIAGRTFPAGEGAFSKKRIAAPGYFETLGIPLLKGRLFDERDRAGAEDVVVISEAIAAEYWPDEDPIGRDIDFGWGPGDRHRIVGVVGDVRHDGLDQSAVGAVYRPMAQFPQRFMAVVLRTSGDPQTAVSAVRSSLQQMDALQPVRGVSTLDAVVERSLAGRQTLMRLLVSFAVVAVMLAVVGVYAVAAQSVGQRTREIGVRIALGARAGDVVRLVLRDEGRLVLIGLGLGLVVAWATTRVLAASLYHVSATDPQVFAVVALVLGGVAFLAGWMPARRAARIDPVSALKGE